MDAARQPLHIEVVTDTYVPDINGVAFSLGHLCTGLRKLGHRVEIIRSGRAHTEFESTVWSWPLPGYWEIKVGAPLPGELFRRWEKQRPDLVYIAIETPLGFSAAAAAIKLDLPVVGGFHTNFREYLQQYGATAIGKIVWSYQKWFHNRMNRTLVPSPDAQGKLVSAGFNKVSILGRGVDTVLFDPARRSSALRGKWRVCDGTPVVLVVGRVSSEKNIGLAIRAFHRMKKIRPDTRCIVVGAGPVLYKLKSENPDVEFPGYLTGVDLATCYASADVLLFPSETETFGNVLTEGMASGLATLSYDYAASGWHCVHGTNGLKVPKGDEAAYLAAAETLLDPDFRNKLGRAARETAKTLGWSSIVAELETIFHEVIQEDWRGKDVL